MILDPQNPPPAAIYIHQIHYQGLLSENTANPLLSVSTRAQRNTLSLRDGPAMVRLRAAVIGRAGERWSKALRALVPKLGHRWDSEALKSENVARTQGLWVFCSVRLRFVQNLFFLSLFHFSTPSE